MLQETNRRLQEYNTSLQQYNSNLQNEANKNGETISRFQKEKSVIMESLTTARDHANSLKSQLDASRVGFILASFIQREFLIHTFNFFLSTFPHIYLVDLNTFVSFED